MFLAIAWFDAAQPTVPKSEPFQKSAPSPTSPAYGTLQRVVRSSDIITAISTLRLWQDQTRDDELILMLAIFDTSG